jgi:Holliday junction resolvase-like predicted endonuclease
MFRNSGEEQAWRYLEEKGHRLLEKNYRTPDRRTEIDLITLKDGVVHFIEVKAWKSGMPVLTQNRKRQAMVRRAAMIYLNSDQFLHSISSAYTDAENQLESVRSGTDSPDKLDRESKAACNPGDELCRADKPSPLETGEYSVSFDFISICNGHLEHIERLF